MRAFLCGDKILTSGMALLQSMVGVQDFQYAEPDILVHSKPSILERFGETGTRCSVALKALCKKKGLHVEVRQCL